MAQALFLRKRLCSVSVPQQTPSTPAVMLPLMTGHAPGGRRLRPQVTDSYSGGTAERLLGNEGAVKEHWRGWKKGVSVG